MKNWFLLSRSETECGAVPLTRGQFFFSPYRWFNMSMWKWCQRCGMRIGLQSGSVAPPNTRTCFDFSAATGSLHSWRSLEHSVRRKKGGKQDNSGWTHHLRITTTPPRTPPPSTTNMRSLVTKLQSKIVAVKVLKQNSILHVMIQHLNTSWIVSYKYSCFQVTEITHHADGAHWRFIKQQTGHIVALGHVRPYRYCLPLTALNFREQNKWSPMVTHVLEYGVRWARVVWRAPGAQRLHTRL